MCEGYFSIRDPGYLKSIQLPYCQRVSRVQLRYCMCKYSLLTSILPLHYRSPQISQCINNVFATKVQHLSFEYFTSRGVTLAGAKAANRV